MPRLIVVSNRVADIHSSNAASSGGLALAMGGALKEEGGVWLGWSGKAIDKGDSPPHFETVGKVTVARIDLSRRHVEEYYNGYANRTLWPLFHHRTDLTAYEQSFRDAYLDVNRTFAHAIRSFVQPDDVIWVQDYHLIPLGRELRALGVDNRIGFFLHIPWPAMELFISLPQHADLVWSLFGYDLVGFQTEKDLKAFCDYFETELDAQPDEDGLMDLFGRRLLARSYPISINPAEMVELGRSEKAQESFRRVCEGNAGRKILLGVDRIDYSKGLPHKFAAFSRFLERFPERRGTASLLQIGQPSRSLVEEYQDLGDELVAEAGRINGRFGKLDWTPLAYHTQSYGRDALAGIYRAADVCLVTPLRDGMNLVAKEFVAAQDPEDPGVLILSRFAGAAEQLTEAILVNPYDKEQCAETIAQAIDMPLPERIERWRALNATISRSSLSAWKDDFMRDLRALKDQRNEAASGVFSF
ncbi:alpha,alpha-trehalose-phosphate synthase (UDP-forming) [Croceicoccus pelagius]|uniref:Trehalose-6-phosphate synthase n=1 Tax=Croceicoccus pelagius TaxID=1703341 RepID=A0A917DNB0_9SPHN|nr:trehalose-6-phosphate synthase [Croceicoccus pelagius]GGD53450.1 trehalose-6-phosphate synthase [Croceicoccus pelagius]